MCTKHILRNLAVAALLLCSKPGLAQEALEELIRGMEAAPQNHAIAVARDDNGGWAAGSAFGYGSASAATERALLECGIARIRYKIASQCELFAVNGQLAKLYRSTSLGTGFLVSGEGHVITARHTLEGASRVLVKVASGDVFEAKVLAVSRGLDIAIAKIEYAPRTYIPVNENPVELKPGDRVFTFGFPVASVLGPEPKYSDGAISATTGIQGDAMFLQVTLPIQPGNSGGPLVREDGTLAGVITSSAAVVPFLRIAGTFPQNVNWATNINYAMPLLLDVIPKLPRTPKPDRAELLATVRQSVVLIEVQKAQK
jgi:S1-C subfamily serine protease